MGTSPELGQRFPVWPSKGYHRSNRGEPFRTGSTQQASGQDDTSKSICGLPSLPLSVSLHLFPKREAACKIPAAVLGEAVSHSAGCTRIRMCSRRSARTEARIEIDGQGGVVVPFLGGHGPSAQALAGLWRVKKVRHCPQTPNRSHSSPWPQTPLVPRERHRTCGRYPHESGARSPSCSVGLSDADLP